MKRYSPMVSYTKYHYGDGAFYNDEKVSVLPSAAMMPDDMGLYVKFEEIESMKKKFDYMLRALEWIEALTKGYKNDPCKGLHEFATSAVANAKASNE